MQLPVSGPIIISSDVPKPLSSEFNAVRPPNLTIFQICILAKLESRELKGEDLRTALKVIGYKKSLPGFSDSMQALEKRGMIESRFDKKRTDESYVVREKYFKLSARGHEELQNARAFFEKYIMPSSDQLSAAPH